MLTRKLTNNSLLLLIVVFALLTLNAHVNWSTCNTDVPEEFTQDKKTINSFVLPNGWNQYYAKVDQSFKLVNVSFFSLSNDSLVAVYIKANSTPSLTNYDHVITKSDTVLTITNSFTQTYYIGVYGLPKGALLNVYSLTVSFSNPKGKSEADKVFWDVITGLMVLFFGVGGVIVTVVVLLLILVCCGVISCAFCKRNATTGINYGYGEGNHQQFVQSSSYQHI